MHNLPLISISIPVYNEADNIQRLYKRLSQLAIKMSDRCLLEFIFTDNHSTDDTWDKIQELAKVDNRIKAIRFSKNFGFQRSILANYLHTKGEAVLQIDADLQDPPELLEEFFQLWQQGYHVIYGVRRKRPENKFMHTIRKIGYWFIDKISEHPIPKNAGDFRLIDRKVIKALAKSKSINPYLRGMIAGMGFRQIGFTYDRDARQAGKSKFRLFQLLKLGFTGIINHSVVPLRIASYIGILFVGLSFCGMLFFLWQKILHPEIIHGVISILVLVLFGIGFQSLLLGILGEYLLRIYIILRAEPLAIIEQTVNFAEKELIL